VQTDCLIIGGGIAGLVTALELLNEGKTVSLIDRMPRAALGGLARESFGGINVVNSPIQKLNGIHDSPALAYEDWCSYADFGEDDELPRAWAQYYTQGSRTLIYDWLRSYGVQFFPVVHWVERGLFSPGNSVPRFHMVWGTGKDLMEKIIDAVQQHPQRQRLTMLFEHKAEALLMAGDRVIGCSGHTAEGDSFRIHASAVVIASGGFTGNLDRVRQHWGQDMGQVPAVLLNGSHDAADGTMHDAAEKAGARLTHLDKQWNYAAGVHHPHPIYKDHGLSLIPPHSALWLNFRGDRIGPVPLITSFDTRFLVSAICHEDRAYSWQVMNWKIAVRELAVSGAEYNDDIRDKKFFSFLKTVLTGNQRLVRELTRDCVDFVVADSLDELVAKMNALNGDNAVEWARVQKEIQHYDGMIDRGPQYFNDEQLRRIVQLRSYRGDRVRTCRYQKILDPHAGPLIAIREFILSRKSLGGIQTNLLSQAIADDGKVLDGLYAVGEAAGFGGGGIHGKRALEGSFLGSCILTARSAAFHIAKGRSLAQDVLHAPVRS
jgi:predicted oxidoreductase